MFLLALFNMLPNGHLQVVVADCGVSSPRIWLQVKN